MATAKTSKATPKKTRASHQKKWGTTVKNNLFLVISVGVLGVIVALTAFAQFQDWRNEKNLRELATAFSSLETDLENKLGVPFQLIKGCSQTQEKFSEGVMICDVSLLNDEPLDTEALNKTKKILSEYSADDIRVFKTSDISYFFSLKAATCNIDYEINSINDNGDYLVLSCTPAIRKPNKQLAIELFGDSQ